jgi:hypothetical protein
LTGVSIDGFEVLKPLVLAAPALVAADRDVDGRANAKWGAWETTGIVDASKAFGPDAFLINVQAHSLWVEKAPGEVGLIAGQPDFTFKREGGQLALIRIPGG